MNIRMNILTSLRSHLLPPDEQSPSDANINILKTRVDQQITSS